MEQPYGGYYSYYDDNIITNTECIEQEKDYFSGLYDAKGNPLYKVKPRLGFI